MQYITIILLLFPILSFSQGRTKTVEFEPANIINNVDFQTLKREGRVTPIFNTDSSEFVIFLSTSSSVTAILLDRNLNTINIIESELPKSRELNILDGGFFANNNYYAILTDNKRSNFSALRLDFDTGEIFGSDLQLYLKKEKYLHSLSVGDYYYIISIPIYSSTINIRRINSQLRVRKNSYDFSDVSFDSTNPKLYNEVNEYIFKGNQRLARITYDNPTTLFAASSYFKIFSDQQKVRFTLDHVIGTTTILEVELNSKLFKSYQVQAPEYVLKRGYSYTSNSYLWSDFLINFIVGDESLEIIVKDITTGDIVGQIIRSKNERFDILNQSLIVDGESGYYDNIRVKEFLNLIEGRKIGVFINKLDDNRLALGFGAAQKPDLDFSEQVMESIGLDRIDEKFPTSYQAYKGNTLSKTTLAIALLSESFELLEGEIPYLIYDRLDDYKERELNGLEVMETIFRIGTSYYHGSYYPDNRKYTIVEFPLN